MNEHLAGHPAPIDKRDIFARIQQGMPGFSRSHKVIGQAILTYPKLFAEKPIEELVAWLNVSAPTIARFCRLVGCEGLRDLKLRIMGSVTVGARYGAPEAPPATQREARELLAQRAQAAIMEGARVPDDIMEAALDRLVSAKVIYAFGSGGVSSWLVEEFQNRFFRLGKHVVASRDGIMQAMFASVIDEDSLVLFCSMGGNNPALLAAMKIAKEYKAFCMVICPSGTELAAGGDLHIPVETHEFGDVLSPTPVRYGMLFMVDALAYGLAIRTRDQVLDRLRRLKQQYVTRIEFDEMRPLGD